MIARLSAWWRARQLRLLEDRTRAAAASYMGFKARYEAELVKAAKGTDE